MSPRSASFGDRLKSAQSNIWKSANKLFGRNVSGGGDAATYADYEDEDVAPARKAPKAKKVKSPFKGGAAKADYARYKAGISEAEYERKGGREIVNEWRAHYRQKLGLPTKDEQATAAASKAAKAKSVAAPKAAPKAKPVASKSPKAKSMAAPKAAPKAKSVASKSPKAKSMAAPKAAPKAKSAATKSPKAKSMATPKAAPKAAPKAKSVAAKSPKAKAMPAKSPKKVQVKKEVPEPKPPKAVRGKTALRRVIDREYTSTKARKDGNPGDIFLRKFPEYSDAAPKERYQQFLKEVWAKSPEKMAIAPKKPTRNLGPNLWQKATEGMARPRPSYKPWAEKAYGSPEHMAFDKYYSRPKYTLEKKWNGSNEKKTWKQGAHSFKDWQNRR